MFKKILSLIILVATLNTTISAMDSKLPSDFTTDDVIVSMPNSKTLTTLFSQYKNLKTLITKTYIIDRLSDKDLSLDDIDRAINSSITNLELKKNKQTQDTIDAIKLNINKVIVKIIKMDLIRNRPISR
ncbi:MAG: hypothetical protein SZ59_C0001G0152 [candidate division TM6 bacterium GW2011_GWF2_28_16]|nr:MAG: hypothetical protein SZ59_C0001G0152 [candidate division TM6 bacterium GW2011_GWF2_28_16]